MCQAFSITEPERGKTLPTLVSAARGSAKIPRIPAAAKTAATLP